MEQGDSGVVAQADTEDVAVDIDWSSANAAPVEVASHFAVQLGTATGAPDHPRPDGVYLVVGHVAPPVAIGTPEAIRKQLEKLNNQMPVTVHGRYFMTRERLAELIQLLTATADNFDRTIAQAGG